MHVKVSVQTDALTDSLTQNLDGSFHAVVTAPREQGKANRRVASLLSAHFGRGIRVRLVSGAHSSSKIFAIEPR